MNDHSETFPSPYDPSELSSYQVVAGKVCLSLADFLVYCANSLGKPHAPLSESQALISVRDAFLDAGLNALKSATCSSSWVQVGLEVGREVPYIELYRRVACTARELLEDSSASNFFFMHKPPGMRVRFETTVAGRHRLKEALYQRLSVWQSEGVVEHVVPGVYEPEYHLFGGPVSMLSVHELFTIDSLTWLDFHVLTASEESGPTWALSLVMLRALFTGLHITDWEDLDVWDRIRRKTGRRLPGEALAQAEFATVAADIQSQWFRHQALLDELSPQGQRIAQSYQQAADPVTARWRSEYFTTRQAYIGPREAAAFFTIFHWNRAALPLTRQALLTEALAARERI
ncbi:MAG: thiopeptide-type bacteriocin biosynthesis protein [Candidatus Tectomicrobia bacterium]|nr:thiopeptide-type bacteriocin biosynthesis protein [Candidatus Tectomicrobia bacterium]